MNFRVFLTPQAEQDIINQAEYLAHDNPEVSDRFLDAVKSSLGQVAHMPQLGSPRKFSDPRLTGIRMWRVKGSEKYLIFYRILDKTVEVVRVLHGARDIDGILVE